MGLSYGAAINCPQIRHMSAFFVPEFGKMLRLAWDLLKLRSTRSSTGGVYASRVGSGRARISSMWCLPRSPTLLALNSRCEASTCLKKVSDRPNDGERAPLKILCGLISILSTTGTIRLATLPENHTKIGQQQEGSLLTEGALHQIKQWLRQCHKSHGNRCRIPESPTWVPKRLVSVQGGSDGSVSVVETSTFSGSNPKYVTLSHCWGTKDPMLMLKKVNERTFSNPGQGIRWSELPRNFRNAVEVARALEVDYIWIDSLCIIQDNGEFATEGQLMHLVYRNSFCNLAAVDSDGCQGGFFPKGLTAPKNLSDTVISLHSPIFGGRSWYILPSDLWECQLLHKVLYTRGWVFQGNIWVYIGRRTSKRLTLTRKDVISSTSAFLWPSDIRKSCSYSQESFLWCL